MRFPSPSNVKRVDNNNKRCIIKTMKPSTKEFAIEAELANLFGFYRGVHIAVDECVPEPIGCGGPATEFEDEVSRKEYSISGLCQKCQNKVFGDEEE